MTMTAKGENAKTLAAILGINEDEAGEILNVTVLITANDDPATNFLKDRLVELLSRTVQQVICRTDPLSEPDLEIVIGRSKAATKVPHVWVGITHAQIIIATTPPESQSCVMVHPIFLILGACYAAASAMGLIVGNALPFKNSEPIIIDFKELLDTDNNFLMNSIDLDEAYLAGAGAVGNAFLYSLRHFDVKGKLYIVDPDNVSDGNLNRCLFFTKEDIGLYKAERLSSVAQPFFKNLNLTPYATALKDVPSRSSGPWIKRLIVGVDSRRARRALQTEIPGEVFDASTTGISEVVLHFHKQPTKNACLSCIYHQDSNEISRENHIAEMLGVSIMDVQQGFITPEVAHKISIRYNEVKKENLIGKAFDSLFKELCGQGILRTPENRQVLAPFSFVSVLAGAYLALEMVRRLQHRTPNNLFNYWRISPWSTPIIRLRNLRSAKPDCEFCSNPTLKLASNMLWASKV